MSFLGLGILNRYVLKTLLTGFLVLSCVIVVLFLTVDLVVDLDEYVEAAKAWAPYKGGNFIAFLHVLKEHHWPQICMLYVNLSGILAAVAVGFSFVALQRSHEFVGVIASGCTLRKMVFPVLVFGALTALPAWYLGEFALPEMSHQLSRSRSDLKRIDMSQPDQAKEQRYALDYLQAEDMQRTDTYWLVSAQEFVTSTQEMVQPRCLQRGDQHELLGMIEAEKAVWQDASETWMLHDGVQSKYNDELQIMEVDAGISTWHSSLTPKVIQAGHDRAFLRLLSRQDLLQVRSNPILQEKEIDYINQLLALRLAKPMMNMLVPLLILPFLLGRESKVDPKVVMASIGCVFTGWGLSTLCQLAPSGLPRLSAWAPVVCLMAIIGFMMSRIKT